MGRSECDGKFSLSRIMRRLSTADDGNWMNNFPREKDGGNDSRLNLLGVEKFSFYYQLYCLFLLFFPHFITRNDSLDFRFNNNS